MMGIAVSGPSLVYGDNQSVLVNSSVPSSQLKKKSNSIAYHLVRECVARDELRTTYTRTNDNRSDLLTKSLRHGEKQSKFVGQVLHYIIPTPLSET